MQEVAGTLAATSGDAAPVAVPTTVPAPALAPNTSMPVKELLAKAPPTIAVRRVYLHEGVAGNAAPAPAHDPLRPPLAPLVKAPPAKAPSVPLEAQSVQVKAPPVCQGPHHPSCWCAHCRDGSSHGRKVQWLDETKPMVPQNNANLGTPRGQSRVDLCATVPSSFPPMLSGPVPGGRAEGVS